MLTTLRGTDLNAIASSFLDDGIADIEIRLYAENLKAVHRDKSRTFDRRAIIHPEPDLPSHGHVRDFPSQLNSVNEMNAFPALTFG
ncbi:MAG: hypothetical protein IPN85_04545 [Flavobacteriales bacterium]|nr:hypothetical protein [Flavobacteriales bacterium]MBK9287563.1 hypothetical protein [Flavobacteriales bacterium]MBL0037275.1 hypothetical protein [Flavobacteriales bacterium]